MALITRRKLFQVLGIAAVSPVFVKDISALVRKPPTDTPEPWKNQMFEIVPENTFIPSDYAGWDRTVYAIKNPDVDDGKVFWLVPLEFDPQKNGRRLAEPPITDRYDG